MKYFCAGFAVSVTLLTATGVLRGENAVASRAVPLTSVVTTGPQKGMERASNVFLLADGKRDNKAYHNYIEAIELGTDSGASNAFLVDATTVQDAIRASKRIILGSRSARTAAPVDGERAIRGKYWLVALLGIGPSGPPRWVVESIVVEGRSVRLTYREPPSTGSHRDALPYYFWASIGTLDPGTYDIELYDADRKVISLMRKVEVESGDSRP
jgi:hypothetical protein